MTYEELVFINNKIKSQVRENKTEKEERKCYKIHFDMYENTFYVMKENTFYDMTKEKVKIRNLRDILEIFKSGYYFTNISVLRNKSFLYNNYVFGDVEWKKLKSLLRHNNVLKCYFLKKDIREYKNYIGMKVLQGFKLILQSYPIVILARDTEWLVVSFEYIASFACMFGDLETIEYLYIENIDNSDTISLVDFFMNCYKLKSIHLEHFDTKHITTFRRMFYHCTALEDINIEILNTDNCRDMSSMFFGCIRLEKLDLSHFYTGNLVTTQYMFKDCIQLKELNLNGWKLNDCNKGGMFDNCIKLLTKDITL